MRKVETFRALISHTLPCPGRRFLVASRRLAPRVPTRPRIFDINDYKVAGCPPRSSANCSVLNAPRRMLRCPLHSAARPRAIFTSRIEPTCRNDGRRDPAVSTAFCLVAVIPSSSALLYYNFFFFSLFFFLLLF